MNVSEAKRHSNSWQSYEAAEFWRRNAAERMRIIGNATQLMLEAAQIRLGSRVLDIAAGTGDQSLMAAQVVGSAGYVLSTDISSSMIKVATEVIQQEGLTNVETKVMDAQNIDLVPDSFDSAISRHGLMFIPDLQKALTRINRVLRTGGKFAALVWSKAENNPVLGLPISIFYRYTGIPLPKPGSPGVFTLSDPYVLSDAFRSAGFHEVRVQAVPHVHRASSAEEFVSARANATSGPLGEAFSWLSEADRKKAKLEIVQALRKFDGDNGFEGPGESLLVVGSK
ncbi:class I SAM-dependent methyltransferase [Bacillus gobiensis]|uniref:class I SAM-dependent methyltransferase n=1 Tax=Bacillus gobiensis TaxID=1441095 RepID=UPI003D260F7D